MKMEPHSKLLCCHLESRKKVGAGDITTWLVGFGLK